VNAVAFLLYHKPLKIKKPSGHFLFLTCFSSKKVIYYQNMNEKLKKVIEESGNNLHLIVANMLETMKWDVGLSSYYYDDTANKPREIDIIAQKEVPVRDEFKGEIDKFKLFLFIECKYFKNELAFRVRKNREEESKLALIIEGMNKHILLEREGLFRNHHYLQTNFIGKLYDSSSADQTKIFNAITQPIKSLTFFKERLLEKGLYYPVVVYGGIDGLYEIKEGDIKNLDNLKKQDNLMFGLKYSYRSVVSGGLKTKHFYIDFIREDRLKDYIDMILKEAEELKKYLFFMRKRAK
jgi:hypothetical protein